MTTTHPDYDPAWLSEDIGAWAERALKASDRSRPGSVERVLKRNRYILKRYIEAIRDVGFADALLMTIQAVEDEGHSDDMVRTAIKPWQEAHGPKQERTYMRDAISALIARVDMQAELIEDTRSDVSIIDAERMALQARMAAIEERVTAMEAAYALGAMAAVGGVGEADDASV